MHIDVEDCRIDTLAPDHLASFLDLRREQDRSTLPREHVFECEADDGLVFEDQDGCALQYRHSAAVGSLARMMHLRPVSRNSSVTWLRSSADRPRSINRVPNPRRVGVTTGGPPCSIHAIATSTRSSAVTEVVQRTSTVPVSFESAPYLIALVQSS